MGLDSVHDPLLDCAPLKPFLRTAGSWLALVLFSCQPNIGDSCTSSSDCSVSEQRTCDTTFPGGYCTRFNCTPGGCPDEAACIAFNTTLASTPACASVQEPPRLQRTACMLRCERDSDCRGGYVCVDMAAVNPWGAAVIESRGGSRVCTLPPPRLSTNETDICTAGAPSVVPPLVSDAGADAATPPDAAAAVDASSADAGP